MGTGLVHIALCTLPCAHCLVHTALCTLPLACSPMACPLHGASRRTRAVRTMHVHACRPQDPSGAYIGLLWGPMRQPTCACHQATSLYHTCLRRSRSACSRSLSSFFLSSSLITNSNSSASSNCNSHSRSWDACPKDRSGTGIGTGAGRAGAVESLQSAGGGGGNMAVKCSKGRWFNGPHLQ